MAVLGCDSSLLPKSFMTTKTIIPMIIMPMAMGMRSLKGEDLTCGAWAGSGAL